MSNGRKVTRSKQTVIKKDPEVKVHEKKVTSNEQKVRSN